MSIANQFFIKPKPGAKVRDPHTGIHLNDEGEIKPRTSFWMRRVNDGDVLEAETPKAKTSGAA